MNMKSKDVQAKTELTRKAIEYYEDLGLVAPSRNEFEKISARVRLL
jgi:DNA-binding transcriptional MerR regulator